MCRNWGNFHHGDVDFWRVAPVHKLPRTPAKARREGAGWVLVLVLHLKLHRAHHLCDVVSVGVVTYYSEGRATSFLGKHLLRNTTELLLHISFSHALGPSHLWQTNARRGLEPRTNTTKIDAMRNVVRKNINSSSA